MSIITRHLQIEGRVQGVGFRWSLHNKAMSLGLYGWVRNCSDGSVEALIRGEQDAVDALTVWAHQGPDHAHVHRVLSNDEPNTEIGDDLKPFQLRPTR